jgi:hypothetical protein
MDEFVRHLPHTVEAVIDEAGNVRLLAPVSIGKVRRALVTVLDEAPTGDDADRASLSEASLARDWDRPEEDAAWSHLQPARSS